MYTYVCMCIHDAFNGQLRSAAASRQICQRASYSKQKLLEALVAMIGCMNVVCRLGVSSSIVSCILPKSNTKRCMNTPSIDARTWGYRDEPNWLGSPGPQVTLCPPD